MDGAIKVYKDIVSAGVAGLENMIESKQAQFNKISD